MYTRVFTGLTGLLLSGLLWANPVYIDVRTSGEFNADHIEGAYHIPFGQIGERISEVTTDKNAQLHLYCRSGRRAELAKQALEAQGFTQVVNEGGLYELKAKLEQTAE